MRNFETATEHEATCRACHRGHVSSGIALVTREEDRLGQAWGAGLLWLAVTNPDWAANFFKDISLPGL